MNKQIIVLMTVFVMYPALAKNMYLNAVNNQMVIEKEEKVNGVLFIDSTSVSKHVLSLIKVIDKIDITDKSDKVFYDFLNNKIKWSKQND